MQQDHKLVTALLVIAAAFLLHARTDAVFGWQPDFVFASLITLSFFLGFFEIVFLTLLSGLIFSWKPTLGIEMYLFILLPLLLYLFRKIIFPLEGWLTNMVSIFFGVVALYLVSSFFTATEHFLILFADIGASIAFGYLVFSVFRSVYPERIHIYTE